jgi:hypothetical protein
MDSIGLDHEEMCESVAWIHLARDDVSFWRAVVNTVINARVRKGWKLLLVYFVTNVLHAVDSQWVFQ